MLLVASLLSKPRSLKVHCITQGPWTTCHAQDDDGLKYLQKRDYGRVPTYLVERKMELAEAAEAAARAKEAALIPPGGWTSFSWAQVTR
jgi:hypothetical protein